MSFSIGSRLIGRPARCLFDRPGEVVLAAYSDDVLGSVPEVRHGHTHIGSSVGWSIAAYGRAGGEEDRQGRMGNG
jgi:hypothetical protein